MLDQIFKAGAAKVDITPPLGTLINGDFIIHYARYIHDNLFAKALVLQNQATVIAFVIVDICAMQKDFIQEVKQLIKTQLGINPENILLSSTHTHAAGSIESLLLGAADLPYRKKLPTLIVEAVRLARQNLRAAQVGFGAVDVPEHVVCRRFYMKKGYVAKNPVTGGQDQVKTNPFGDEHLIEKRVSPMDTQVSYLAVKGIDGQWISLLANYSMHYVGDWENGTISADYFGVFSNYIQQKLGADVHFVGMMTNGTSGEANIWDFLDNSRYPTGHFAKEKLIGEDIAEKVCESMAQVKWQTNPALTAAYTELELRLRKPTSAEVEAAKAVVSETDYEHIHHVDQEALRRIYAREQVLLYDYPDTEMFPIQTLKIGDGVIGALGGEFFAETGLKLKAQKQSNHYFTITMANGYVGYVPPAHEIERGGYETWRCRTSYFEESAEDAIRNKLVELIK